MNTCSGCGEDSSSVSHRCDRCERRNHPFCGVKVTEGHGGAVRCIECDNPARKACRQRAGKTSPSPIIAAFTRTPPKRRRENDDDAADESEGMERLHHVEPEVSAYPTGSESPTRSDSSAEYDSSTESDSSSSTKSPKQRKRRAQVVSTIDRRVAVVKRMQELQEQGVKTFKAAVVRDMSWCFSGVYKNDIEKASSWWKNRVQILSAETKKSISTRVRGHRTRVQLKTTGGRGWKHEEWTVWLHSQLLEEFLRLRAVGVKFSNSLLIVIAQDLLRRSTSQWKSDTLVRDVRLHDKITYKWVQAFNEHYDIVQRRVSGKLVVSEEKQVSIDRAIAYHLGEVMRQFNRGELQDDMVCNMDETHFVINMDDGKTLELKGASRVKYTDVVAADEGLTLVVKLRGGSRARLEVPMVIFTNANASDSIRGVPDVPGVVYRSGPKGWMDQRVFCEWIKEDQCVRRDPYDREQTIFMDNVAGHKAIESMEDEAKRSEMEAVLERKRVTLRFLPANSTDLCQPADTSIIQKIKQKWRQRWEMEKLDRTISRQYSNMPNKKGEWSGKLLHPKKEYYLRLAKICCAEVSAMVDENGVNIVRKAMIRCGLNKNLNGMWEEEQLSPELQAIVNKYRENFDGKKPIDFSEAIV